MVRREDWGQHKNGTLFVFDNVAKGCADSRALNPRQTGDLQLVLEFGTAHEHIPSIILGEFAKLLEIDSDGAVLYDIHLRTQFDVKQVVLNNVQLEYLAMEVLMLKPYFYGVVACDRLPKKPAQVLLLLNC